MGSGRKIGHSCECIDVQWREVTYMLREIQTAIDPSRGLSWSLAHWEGIAADLRESPRKRQRQQRYLVANIKAYRTLS